MGSKGSKGKKESKASKSDAGKVAKSEAKPPAAPKASPKGSDSAKKVDTKDVKKKGGAVERVQKELEKNTGASKQDASPAAKPSSNKVKFQRNQWVIENCEQSDGEIQVTVEKTMHAVALYNCKGASIKVSGKSASVQIEGCQKTTVFVEDVVGTIQISNCKSVKVFISGIAPSISIDKTDGILLDLSEKCVNSPDFMITAANSSEMNAAFDVNGDKKEFPLPEQFVHKLKMSDGKGKIESSVSSLYEA